MMFSFEKTMSLCGFSLSRTKNSQAKMLNFRYISQFNLLFLLLGNIFYLHRRKYVVLGVVQC